MGIFSPFYILHLRNFGGGIEQFTNALAFMIAAQGATNLLYARIADRINRRILYVFNNSLLATIIIMLTVITKPLHLYILQILYGITFSLFTSLETSLLGDTTEKYTRGRKIGHYFALMSFLTAFIVLIVGKFNFDTTAVFYLAAGTITLSTMISFFGVDK